MYLFPVSVISTLILFVGVSVFSRPDFQLETRAVECPFDLDYNFVYNLCSNTHEYGCQLVCRSKCPALYPGFPWEYSTPCELSYNPNHNLTFTCKCKEGCGAAEPGLGDQDLLIFAVLLNTTCPLCNMTYDASKSGFGKTEGEPDTLSEVCINNNTKSTTNTFYQH